jgi:nitroimidazol reductase NimA-like FMN-containing flavoprotein (pyridoxamine 5'-phosphate oxidase superfamily)
MLVMTGHVDVMPDAECRELLATASVGRVSVTNDALPVIAPVNYVLDGDTVLFRTRRDGMLARACDDAVIAFEIDELSADGSSGWSVNVVGIASLLSGREQLPAGRLGLVSAAGADRDQLVRLRIGVLTGRRISPAEITATSA